MIRIFFAELKAFETVAYSAVSNESARQELTSEMVMNSYTFI